MDGLRAALRIETVTQLPSVGAKTIPQIALLFARPAERLVKLDGKRLERIHRAFFACLSRFDDDPLKLPPVLPR
jgi:hypothetical protein